MIDRAEFQAQLGHRLRLIRNDRGLTQFEVAYRAGCVKQTISNTERGLYLPSLLFIFVLAQVLEVHPKTLLFGEEE
jgi:transcriptional regulator with XRE-family HTH domain